MPALDTLLTEVEKTLLVLAQPVVVLIERRVEDSRNPVAGICLLPLSALAGDAAGRLCLMDQFFIVRSGLPDAVVIEIVSS